MGGGTSSSIVTEPDWIVFPDTNTQMPDELYSSVMDDTIQTFITAIGENINDDPTSIKIEGIDYDANGNILLKYEEIPEGERKYTLAVSEGSLKIGDVVTVSENKQLNTVNGVAATNTQQDDYNKVSDKIFCHQEKETYEFIYDSVSVEEKEYNVTVKRIA